MSDPRKIFIFHEGRLANQLLAWANGRYVIRHLKDRKLLVAFPPLMGKCTMPFTDFVSPGKPPGWPEVRTSELETCKTDCIWMSAWENFPSDETLAQFLGEIRFDPDLLKQSKDLLYGNNCIGVHIRYGDFVAVDENNPPPIRPSFVRAPNSYYIEQTDRCLAAMPDHKIFLCTDGTPEEVAWFTERYHPLQHPKNDGLLDFLTLSQCRIIVASPSTFAPTAALLGGVPFIHRDHDVKDVRRIISKACSKMKYQFQPTCQVPIEVLNRIYCDAFGFKPDGRFVEVGAHDGWHWSCTWGLAEIGWRGWFIEPVPELFAECCKTYHGKRNIDIVNCCIGTHDGTATMGIGEYGGSLVEDRNPFKVTQYSLDSFLESRHVEPKFDLLIIDVEGAEDQVLAGFTVSKWLPKLVIIERPPVPNKFTEHGYEQVYSDWINTIYQRKA